MSEDLIYSFKSRDFNAKEKKELGLSENNKAPSWLKKPPKGFKVVKAMGRGAADALEKAREGYTGPVRPNSGYYEERPEGGGYFAYALVPIKTAKKGTKKNLEDEVSNAMENQSSKDK